VALPSDAGAGDLLCSLSLLSFSVGVVGIAVDEGVGGMGTGGIGGITGGGINGDFSIISMEIKIHSYNTLPKLTRITWLIFIPYQWNIVSNIGRTGCFI